MKVVTILTAILLSACATGVVDPIENPVEEVPETNSAPPPPSPTQPTSDCEVDSYRVGNCLVKKVYCNGLLKRTDVMCDRGRDLFPWEYIPDPPFNGEK